MYCTGKVSGWFFRHEMSDLFNIKFAIDKKMDQILVVALAAAVIYNCYFLPASAACPGNLSGDQLISNQRKENITYTL